MEDGEEKEGRRGQREGRSRQCSLFVAAQRCRADWGIDRCTKTESRQRAIIITEPKRRAEDQGGAKEVMTRACEDQDGISLCASKSWVGRIGSRVAWAAGCKDDIVSTVYSSVY